MDFKKIKNNNNTEKEFIKVRWIRLGKDKWVTSIPKADKITLEALEIMNR